MRKVAITVGILLLTCWATLALSQGNRTANTTLGGTEIGRYQIVTGTYRALTKVNGKVGGDDVQTVFRIDTKTGRTWEFQNVGSDDDPKKSFVGWEPVGELK